MTLLLQSKACFQHNPLPEKQNTKLSNAIVPQHSDKAARPFNHLS